VIVITILNSSKAPSSGNRYAQAIGLTDFSQIVFVSGQVGATAEGFVPESFAEQCRLVWQNIAAQLLEADMTLDHLVKITTIVTDAAFIPAYRAVREEILGNRQIASTALVAGLFDPRWNVEIEAIAAR
jgi:enamine deaminase RidA (YjgF/YER057c/UK114 family)